MATVHVPKLNSFMYKNGSNSVTHVSTRLVAINCTGVWKLSTNRVQLGKRIRVLGLEGNGCSSKETWHKVTSDNINQNELDSINPSTNNFTK